MKLKHAVILTLLRILGIRVYATHDGWHFIRIGPRAGTRWIRYIEDL